MLRLVLWIVLCTFSAGGTYFGLEWYDEQRTQDGPTTEPEQTVVDPPNGESQDTENKTTTEQEPQLLEQTPPAEGGDAAAEGAGQADPAGTAEPRTVDDEQQKTATKPPPAETVRREPDDSARQVRVDPVEPPASKPLPAPGQQAYRDGQAALADARRSGSRASADRAVEEFERALQLEPGRAEYERELARAQAEQLYIDAVGMSEADELLGALRNVRKAKRLASDPRFDRLERDLNRRRSGN